MRTSVLRAAAAMTALAAGIPAHAEPGGAPTWPAGNAGQATRLARSVSIAISNLATATIDFNVANANTLFASGNHAFNDMASYMTGIFDMGMPFLYGRHVY